MLSCAKCFNNFLKEANSKQGWRKKANKQAKHVVTSSLFSRSYFPIEKVSPPKIGEQIVRGNVGAVVEIKNKPCLFFN